MACPAASFWQKMGFGDANIEAGRSHEDQSRSALERDAAKDFVRCIISNANEAEALAGLSWHFALEPEGASDKPPPEKTGELINKCVKQSLVLHVSTLKFENNYIHVRHGAGFCGKPLTHLRCQLHRKMMCCNPQRLILTLYSPTCDILQASSASPPLVKNNHSLGEWLVLQFMKTNTDQMHNHASRFRLLRRALAIAGRKDQHVSVPSCRLAASAQKVQAADAFEKSILRTITCS
eukprot:scaffold74536_cov20-Tisochrysis_lutea.AAC.1